MIRSALHGRKEDGWMQVDDSKGHTGFGIIAAVGENLESHS